jgi:hypothetical protein
MRNGTIKNDTSALLQLFLLKNDASTSFILEVIDSNLVPIQDALVYVQRYYPGNNTFSTVQIALTDSNGKSVAFLETETVEYKFLIVKDGAILLETEKRKVFPESTPYTLTFRVGTGSGNPFSQYENLSNLFYSLTYNETNKLVTYTYIDTSGTTHYGRLLVELQNPSGLARTICDVNNTASSATLLCNVTGWNGTIVSYGYISRSPEQLVGLLNSFINSARDIFGDGGLIMGFLILAAIALITIYNPTVQIISLNVALIMLNIIGLMSLSPIFIFGFLSVSILILIVLKL